MKQTRKETAPNRPKPGPGADKADGKTAVLSEEEQAAMQETLRERRSGKSNNEGAVLAKIAEMPEPDRGMAKRLHAIIKANAPTLSPRTWYGMPAYANKDGNVVCYFQNAQKFKARYATIGFNNDAHLDEGNMWPVAFALKELTAAEEARISTLVKKAVGKSE